MRVVHRCAGVNEQMTLRVGVGAVLLDEITIGASEQSPIEVAQIVAGIVLAILSEFG